ncbi:hypothetical protein ScPMuIL_004936 [Solemya velum]
MATVGLQNVVRRGIISCVRQHKARLSATKQQTTYLQKWICPCSFYCTHVLYRNEATVIYRDGLPVFSVPLPSRKELCEFVLKPVSHTVGDFLQFLNEEDHGIDRAVIYTEEGTKVAKSTTIDILLKSKFKLVVNNQEYYISPPEHKSLSDEDLEKMSDVKLMIGQLYSHLNVEEYQLEQQQRIQKRLEDLQEQIAPLEKTRGDLVAMSHKRTTFLSWFGLGLMGAQFGVLARLTWWEYSWDIMEPVTYFVTYGTTMAMYAYFVLTKQEYTFPDVKDREFLVTFYKHAQKQQLDVGKYNRLKDAISKAEFDLQRLQDPLQLRLPIQEIQKKL